MTRVAAFSPKRAAMLARKVSPYRELHLHRATAQVEFSASVRGPNGGILDLSASPTCRRWAENGHKPGSFFANSGWPFRKSPERRSIRLVPPATARPGYGAAPLYVIFGLRRLRYSTQS